MSSETTTDHDRIREWTEARGGRPSVVRTGGEHGGVLRLDFGPKEENFEETGWDEWFEVFEESNLAMILQETTADGKESRFNKLIGREHAEHGGSRHHPERNPPAARAAEGTAAPKKAPAKKAAPNTAAAKDDKPAAKKAAAKPKADKPAAEKAPAKKPAAKKPAAK